MKLLLSLSLIGAIALGDEIERIESIVKDVSVLRQKYESCHEALEKIETAPAQCEVNKLELMQRHQELLALQQKYDALSSEHEKAGSEAQKRTGDLQRQLALLNERDIERSKKLETAQKRLAELEAAVAAEKGNDASAEMNRLQEQRTALEKEKHALQQRLEDLNANVSRTKSALEEKTARNLQLEREKEEQSQHLLTLETQMAALHAQQQQLMQELEKTRRDNKVLSGKNTALEKSAPQAVAPLQCEKTETMPKLVMKPGYEPLSKPRDVVWDHARTYRMNKEAPIYDAPNGHAIETWEARRSFTSLQEREGWIRITGYFVDRVWKSARDRYLWVKAEDATQR